MSWLLRRLAQALLTFVVCVLLLFIVMRATPGDPLARLDAEAVVTPEEASLLRSRFGLDQPLPQQLAAFLGGVARGDLGVSISRYPDRVGDLIVSRLPGTLLLGGTVLLLNFTVGLWLGVLQARRAGSWLDRGLTWISLTGYAMPAFWLGLLLVAAVSLQWQLLPATQMRDPLLPTDASWLTRTGDALAHLILPALTLTIVTLAGTMRYQRAAMLEVLDQDYIRAARARGLSERRVIWAHAWPNALFPVLTLFGLWLPLLVTGSVFVESVFNWPGLGALTAEAVATRDYPVLMGTAMLGTALVLAGGVLADMGYRWLDPRTRTE